VLRKTSAVLALVVCAVALAGPALADAPLDGSSTPVADAKYPQLGDARIDVLSYDLRLTWFPNQHRLNGVATLSARPTDASGTFKLELAPGLKIDSLTVATGTAPAAPARFTRKGIALRVSHPVTDQPMTVRIGYHGKPAGVRAPTSRPDARTAGWHTSGDQVWTTDEPFGAYTWYPANDTPSDKALYAVRIDAPKGMVGISNGAMTSRTTNQSGRTVTTFANADPIASYLVALTIGPYRHVLRTGPHGLPMSFWVPRGHASYLTPLLATGDAVRFLESKLGPYPFDRVGVVVTPGGNAVETQTMISLGSGSFRYGNTSVRQTIAHDLAHAWYGDSVTPQSWRDLWMSEGFATYLEARYAVSKGWSSWSSWVDEWTRNDDYWRYLYGPPGKYHAQQFGQVNVNRCTALMLIRLRDKIGAAMFDRALQEWPQTQKDTTTWRGEYVNWLETQTGTELSDFFDKWLDSATSPA
jgi:aminopeptidase N